MKPNQPSDLVPPGWVGGFAESNPAFAYPNPDLSSLPMLGNMDNIKLLQRQQGVCHPKIGCMNVEVTVTGQRGWVNETTRAVAADMTVTGQIWFSPFAKENPIFQILWNSFKNSKLPFPSDKAKAIKVTTHLSGNPGGLATGTERLSLGRAEARPSGALA